MKTMPKFKLHGSLFFGSVTSFKELFDFNNDPVHVVIDFVNARIYDYSGLEALNNIAEKYDQVGKKLYLENLSEESRDLLKKARNIVNITVIEDVNWHLADDRLG